MPPLYFQRTASYIWGSTTVTYSNSTEFTFAGATAEKNNVTYSAEVRTMGNVTDYDRPFKVEIDKEMSTGIQGVHFDTNLDTLKIKAGKSNAYVRITFYRTPDLLDSTLTVVLHLIENDTSMPGSTNTKNDQWNSSSENLDVPVYVQIQRTIFRTDLLGPWFGEGFLGSLDASEIHRCQFGHGLDSERLVASRTGRSESLLRTPRIRRQSCS